MMVLKYMGPLIVALSLDAFDLFISVGLVPLGIIGLTLGAAIVFTVDVVFGTGLIALLIYLDLFSMKDLLSFSRLPFILSKLIPGIDDGPWYTVLVITLIFKKEASEGGIAGKAMGVAAGAVGAQSVVQTVRQAEKDTQTAHHAPSAPARTPAVMQDIRIPSAANDTAARRPLAA